jgi:hypothetical protein
VLTDEPMLSMYAGTEQPIAADVSLRTARA